MLLFGSGRRPRSAAVLCARVTPNVHSRTTPTAFVTAGPRGFLTLQMISVPDSIFEVFTESMVTLVKQDKLIMKFIPY